MKIATRLRTAWSLLAGRGDNGEVCSFCGNDCQRVEMIVAGPGSTSICNRCVFLCNQVLLEHAGSPGFKRKAGEGYADTISVDLSHEEVILAPIERVALEELLTVMVETLPECRLVAWQYMHGQGRFDLLTVEIVSASAIAAGDMRVMANQSWRRLRDVFLAARARSAANKIAPLLASAQAALDATRAYARAVARSSKEPI